MHSVYKSKQISSFGTFVGIKVIINVYTESDKYKLRSLKKLKETFSPAVLKWAGVCVAKGGEKCLDFKWVLDFKTVSHFHITALSSFCVESVCNGKVTKWSTLAEAGVNTKMFRFPGRRVQPGSEAVNSSSNVDAFFRFKPSRCSCFRRKCTKGRRAVLIQSEHSHSSEHGLVQDGKWEWPGCKSKMEKGRRGGGGSVWLLGYVAGAKSGYDL